MDLPHKNFEVSEFGGVSSSSYRDVFVHKRLSAGMKKVFELSGISS